MFLGRLTSLITHRLIETSIDMNAGHRYGLTINVILVHSLAVGLLMLFDMEISRSYIALDMVQS